MIFSSATVFQSVGAKTAAMSVVLHDGTPNVVYISQVHYVDDVVYLLLPASYDTGASAAFGAQAYLQVVAFTGTDVTVAIQDSADNVSFAAVAGLAFTQTTAANTAQRIAISNTATVRRYVAATLSTVGGFTALSFAVVLVKNQIANQVF